MDNNWMKSFHNWYHRMMDYGYRLDYGNHLDERFYHRHYRVGYNWVGNHVSGCH